MRRKHGTNGSEKWKEMLFFSLFVRPRLALENGTVALIPDIDRNGNLKFSIHRVVGRCSEVLIWGISTRCKYV